MMNWRLDVFDMKDGLEGQRLLFVIKCKLPSETFAVVRLTWFDCDGIRDIDEINLIYEGETLESMIPQFATIVEEALTGGADVSILTDTDPELLGLSVQ